MIRTRRIDTLDTGYSGDLSVIAILAAIISVMALVWLVLKISADPMERTRLPEEAKLAAMTLVPASGPWLGVNVMGPDEPLAGGQMPGGATVTGVMVNSPAESAGLVNGDVITGVGNTPVNQPLDLRRAFLGKKPGDTVMLTINRAGAQQQVQARLGTAPAVHLAAATAPAGNAAAGNAPATPAPTSGSQVWLGIDVQALEGMLAKQLGPPAGSGVVVANVYPGSPAAASGIQQGDVIQGVGRTPVTSIDAFAALVAGRKPGDTLTMKVYNRNGVRDLAVTLGTPPAPGQQLQPTLPEPEVEIEAAWLGLDLIPLTPAEVEELGLPPGSTGMLVDGIAPGLGVDAGFQVGDVVVGVNGMSTPTVKAFKEAAEGAAGALVDVVRFGRHIYISISPPGNLAANTNQKPQARQVGWLQLW